MKTTLTPTGKQLFRFVVIADTHVNQSEEQASSFFPLNRLANQRAAQAFNAAARYDPSFAIHLGDIVHPIPSHPGFHEAAENYRRLSNALKCPVHLTPGNHDVGDKPWPLAPVAQIVPEFMAAYEREFGSQWYQWHHEDCHFFVLNTSLLNTGLPEEREQQAWFEQQLARTTGRIFLCLHYPPYVRDPDEPSHYDNIDEPGRRWLLALLAEHQVEAVFCGHVHNLWYDQYAGTEIYLLPSTAFVRQDYSELQRCLPPGQEGGRQDVDKLGFFVVDVYETGHVARFIRSDETDPAGVSLDDTLSASVLHPKCQKLPNLGIDPGYPWASDVEIQPSGALDAFDSKLVRNDYPLFTLFDLGVSRMRIPLSDFSRPEAVQRFQKLKRIGMRAQIVATSLPSADQIKTLQELAPGIDALELVAPESELHRQVGRVSAVMDQLPGLRLIVSKLRQPCDAKVDGLTYGHLIFHGWVPAEAEQIHALADAGYTQAEISFRVRFAESPLEMAERISTMSRETGMRAGMLVRLATDNPAQPQDDEPALCMRLVEAAVAAYRHPTLNVVLEGMVDFDRGYFLRLGMVDRSFNPRVSGCILKYVIATLARENLDIGRIERRVEAGLYRVRIHQPAGWSDFLIFTADASEQGSAAIDVALQAGQSCWSLVDGEQIVAGAYAARACRATITAVYLSAPKPKRDCGASMPDSSRLEPCEG
ncbi:Calcineurin-like phosphoesterase family protein 5 [Cupriavidus taiwanensis]|uniref:metallophosphoesterase family protein n=1 Tax=Cupriavidus taiwanensis TaxID=164546 RepID=UPI000E185B8A|nr:metallophosphoesterase [Cupriavidus taiwanensis]SOZ20105.1 Calcineurin-like phosphoesterase family protein 5 [Cupriavidus taiwanensis]SOZ33327.1 Calcineurin-like phosphoesterase family protein 5 [Cupriavidus taiwanensis]SOZ48642.1 Calcineurin-like phosphoesterase family protein 5 [Cupriavidus taiwanensis]